MPRVRELSDSGSDSGDDERASGAAVGGDDDAHCSCAVCLNPFDGDDRRPWDLGCGHSFCEACLRASPRSFRSCPGA